MSASRSSSALSDKPPPLLLSTNADAHATTTPDEQRNVSRTSSAGFETGDEAMESGTVRFGDGKEDRAPLFGEIKGMQDSRMGEESSIDSSFLEGNAMIASHGQMSESSPPLSPRQQPLRSSALSGRLTEIDVNESTATTTREYESESDHQPPPSIILHPAHESALHTSHLAGDDDEYYDDQTLPNRTVLEEKEMRRQLLDIESSFLPEPSTIDVGGVVAVGADDTYAVGVDVDNSSQITDSESQIMPLSPFTPLAVDDNKSIAPRRSVVLEPSLLEDGDTQLDLDATPSAGNEGSTVNTTSLETLSSSPTADAAARTVSRVLSSTFSRASRASSKAHTASEHSDYEDRSQQSAAEDDVEATPRVSDPRNRNHSPICTASRWLHDSTGISGGESGGESSHLNSTTPSSERRRKRPKFLTSRQSSHRFSTSSIGTDTTSSEATMGVDFAIQTGGAAPANNSIHRSHSHGRPKMDLSRSTSLGSMASGVSGLSDDHLIDRRGFSGISDASLHTLDEEETSSQTRPGSSERPGTAPMTPKAQPRDHGFPTDTIIADHVKNIQVPSTFARAFRENNVGLSPDKRSVVGAPTPGFARSGKTMTLKEQSSTIDRLSKENFDLKMRIHFLNEALNKRSEEGIKEMISENVELKSDKLKLHKDNQALRRTIRELERLLKERGDGDRDESKESEKEDEDEGTERGESAVDEEELFYLRERIETYEEEIERLRTESIVRESEKRRLAEIVKSMGEGRVAMGSEAGAREERDMWKDMLDAETAAREQAEEENRKLRDELFRVKSDAASSVGPSKGSRAGFGRMSSVVSRSTISERDVDRAATASSSTLVEFELLRQENAELRREVSAQTSMLTSRNREKERLYQEIEDLKLGQRRVDGRSVAGDSIFERSVSRAQDRGAGSLASEGTRSRSDTERENLEIKNGELRDQLSTLKLENQNIRAQLEECMGDLEALDRQYQEDIDQAEEEFQNLQLERDQALQLLEEQEAALQDLKAEAQEELDSMGDELDQKMDECQRLEVELRNQQENLKALQAEMRSASEGIIRLEEDAQSNLQKYKAVQEELEDSNRELEQMEKSLYEANTKLQRLTVQQESSQNEIAFLREEQDGDKIKIGDLESELKTTQMGLQSEKEKTRELDRRLAEERHQREVVGGKEKQEVQRIMNELNREATAAKDEIRKLKKNLSQREIEASTWKERFMELENSLREVLGDLSGTKSSLLMSITKLQKELESTSLELESTRAKLDEKESLLRNRDALLESHGLETRKLGDLLERERQAHRADKHSFEQALKSHHQASRTITQNNSRISELEAARSQDRRRFATIEQQYKDQLSERNALYLTLWKRLSAMCGPDWAHSNSLINGNLPSQEVIGNMLFWPGFSRNLLLAVKTVENIISGFKTRIKSVERDLSKEYQNLEHNLNLRLKKLERLEDLAHNLKAHQAHHQRGSSNPSSPEISKLRGENRLLKAELNLLQSHSRARAAAAAQANSPSPNRFGHPPAGAAKHVSRSSGSNTSANALARYNSTSTNATVDDSNNSATARARSDRSNSAVSHRSSGIPQPAQSQSHYSSSATLVNSNHPASVTTTSNAQTQLNPAAPPPPPTTATNSSQHSYSSIEPSQEKWIQRLKELERRLKAEREARLLDRSGARKRLEERSAENEELRAALERERMRSRAGNLLPAPQIQQADGPADDHHGGRASAAGSHAGDASERSDTDGYDDGDAEEGERVVRAYRYHDSPRRSSRGGERGHSSHRSRNRHAAGGMDEYDGEDEDDDTGTGTDGGGSGGLTIEVEV
ncbi:hypothetical protein AJ80_07423 [Polytolypa hystricis UAMH7299]|uniref:Anucleate primary sterigmata protein B n=1 Tax=Polytolypa hystricis (strain UAMH7299) TaxID=1447883 RepID=A0A2B7XQ96_POLH7|nr:hypothetical protein AJ80_07423 [Polytolypa hystricis UAMH7299]